LPDYWEPEDVAEEIDVDQPFVGGDLYTPSQPIDFNAIKKNKEKQQAQPIRMGPQTEKPKTVPTSQSFPPQFRQETISIRGEEVQINIPLPKIQPKTGSIPNPASPPPNDIEPKTRFELIDWDDTDFKD